MIGTMEIPTIEDWMTLPLERLAELVTARQVTVFLALDGTKRHYLLRHPELQGRITDPEHFIKETMRNYARVFRLFFDAGVHTLVVPLMNDDNFVSRGPRYIEHGMNWLEQMTLHEPFPQVYRDYHLQARLYGDYSYNPAAAFIRPRIERIDGDLREMTVTGGPRQILFGMHAGSIIEEFIARSGELQNRLGRPPTEMELRQSWFPEGPEKIDIFICVGWLVSGGLIPLIYGHQSVDMYNLPGLGLDLSETAVRHILYDHLFMRHQTPFDGTEYSPEDLSQLNNYYAKHRDCVLGTGELVGPQVWHPYHHD